MKTFLLVCLLVCFCLLVLVLVFVFRLLLFSWRPGGGAGPWFVPSTRVELSGSGLGDGVAVAVAAEGYVVVYDTEKVVVADATGMSVVRSWCFVLWGGVVLVSIMTKARMARTCARRAMTVDS